MVQYIFTHFLLSFTPQWWRPGPMFWRMDGVGGGGVSRGWSPPGAVHRFMGGDALHWCPSLCTPLCLRTPVQRLYYNPAQSGDHRDAHGCTGPTIGRLLTWRWQFAHLILLSFSLPPVFCFDQVGDTAEWQDCWHACERAVVGLSWVRATFLLQTHAGATFWQPPLPPHPHPPTTWRTRPPGAWHCWSQVDGKQPISPFLRIKVVFKAFLIIAWHWEIGSVVPTLSAHFVQSLPPRGRLMQMIQKLMQMIQKLMQMIQKLMQWNKSWCKWTLIGGPFVFWGFVAYNNWWIYKTQPTGRRRNSRRLDSSRAPSKRSAFQVLPRLVSIGDVCVSWKFKLFYCELKPSPS